MLGAIVLFEQSLTNIVSITFTSLVLAELLNVASEIQTWCADGAAMTAKLFPCSYRFPFCRCFRSFIYGC